MTLDIELPKHPVGTRFTWRPSKLVAYDATVIGYHVEHNTDTNYTNVSYRIGYNFAGLQEMTAVVARATVDRALARDVSTTKQPQSSTTE